VGGMNNWLSAIMTIFGQRFNTCSSKFGGGGAFRSSGYAPGNSDWWPCGFVPIFAITK